MDYNANEVKVGAVVISGFVILMGFIAAIVGVNWDDDTKEYHTFLQSIPGIVEGAVIGFKVLLCLHLIAVCILEFGLMGTG